MNRNRNIILLEEATNFILHACVYQMHNFIIIAIHFLNQKQKTKNEIKERFQIAKENRVEICNASFG